MKHLPFLFGSALALAAVPAFADVMVDTVSFTDGIAGDGVEVFGPAFDPRLGTLTGVSLSVNGIYTPHMFAPGAVSTVGTVYDNWSSYSLNSHTAAVGTYDFTRDGGFLIGPPIAVDFDTGPLLNIGNYIGYPGPGPAYLAYVAAFTRLATPIGATFDDVSVYKGTLQVTYTYTVPEPSSLLLLCAGFGFLVAGKGFFFEKKNQKTFARLG